MVAQWAMIAHLRPSMQRSNMGSFAMWPSFKLISYFMPVSFKTKCAMAWASSNLGFFSTKGQVTLMLIVGSGQSSKLFKILCLSYLFANCIMI